MKKIILVSILAVTALTFTSCSSNNKPVAEFVRPDAVKQVSHTDTVIETTQKKLSPEERQLLLAKIAAATNPDEAKQMWLHNEDDTVSEKAYSKFNELMRVKISGITDPEKAKLLWLTEPGDVSTTAYTKYVKLMSDKISGLTNSEDAKRIWMNETGDVSTIAYTKYKALGGKD